MNKEEIRSSMRRRRAALSAQEQEEAARCAYERLRGFEPYARARTVMAYMASRGELSLERVIRERLADAKALILPRCEQPGIMTARRIASFDQLTPGAYGLLEPSARCEIVAPETIDLILVPGTAFDRRGGRVGQGGGYYDRFLPGLRAVCVGICHDFALLDAAPAEAHDIRMDAVLTPGHLYLCGDTQK